MLEAPAPQAAQPTTYTPAGPPDPLIFEEFEGINTATTRPGVPDKQAYWLDGFMPLGPRRNLRTMWGLSAAVYTPASAIIFFDFANIGNTPIMVTFHADGSINQVNTNTNAVTAMAVAGTITTPSRFSIGMAQYGAQYVLIVASQTNGYFIWDGTTFFKPGDAFLTGTIPLAIGGTSIETYTGRIWIANGSFIIFSAPGSLIDFSSASGGGNFQSSDSFLRRVFVQLKQTNGFLYTIADSSINYISGVQTSGTGPPITTFTNQNADPEVGTPWPNTVVVFNRNLIFANSFGVHVSYGGAVTKISEMIDGVFNTSPDITNPVPSSAKAIVFGKKIFILLISITDPVTGLARNKLLMWNGKIWWASEQDVSLIFIQFQEIDSILTAWGTNGASVYRMFNQPSTVFVKTAQTKFWDTPGGYQFTKFVVRLWGIVKYYSASSPTINVAIDNESGTTTNPLQVTPNISNGVFSIAAPDAITQQGVLTGFTVTTNAADMSIVSMMIQNKIAGYRG